MKTNILANLLGKFWTIASSFLFVPIYIKILGIDGYAIISFSLIIISVLAILDAGLSQTIIREMSRADLTGSKKYLSFITLEKVYLFTVLLCSLIGILSSNAIYDQFVNNSPYERGAIIFCIGIISIESGMQILLRFYISAFMGMERQVEANILNILWGICRNALVVLVIVPHPSLEIFFSWQLFSTVALLVVANQRLRSALRPWRGDGDPRFDLEALRRVRRFSLGVLLISLVAMVNYNLDRLMLSFMFDIRTLGYYSIALSMGTGILALSAPFLASIQPRLTTLFSQGRVGEAGQLYIQIATLVAILVFPLMAVIGTNSETVVLAWTGNPLVATQSAFIVPWVVGAYALLAMASLAFGVALANGFTRYNNILGFVVLAISVPGYWFTVGRFGVIGAAILFLAIQFSVSTVFHILIDRRFLHLGVLRTYLQLYLSPAAIALLLAVALRWAALVVPDSRLGMIVYLAFSYLFVAAGTAAVVSLVFRMRWHLSDLTAGRYDVTP